MEQLLQPGWWLSFFPQAAPWWFFCLLLSVAALPLSLKVFRGLPDRGASLSVGVGIFLTTWIAWLFSLEWFTYRPESAMVRLLVLFVGAGLLGAGLFWRRRHGKPGLEGLAPLYPGALFLAAGLIPLPHFFLTIWLAGGLVFLGGLVAWAGRWHRMAHEIRKVLVPFIIAQFLFLLAFLFFTNVRSYIPYATFELSLWQAEKYGNYNHLSSVMSSDFLPPKDLWYNEEPTNYYYGGHLITGTLAKATFTPTRIAFNLGLATIFALTMTLSFGLVYALTHTVAARLRLPGRLQWHSGMVWGLFGALAISMFGNLDPVRQYLQRGADGGVVERIRAKQRAGQGEWTLETGVPASVGLQAYAAANRPLPAVGMEELRAQLERDLARLQEQAPARERIQSTAQRFSGRVGQIEEGPRLTSTRHQQDLSGFIFDQEFHSALRNATNLNAEEVSQRLLRLIVQDKFVEARDLLNEVAEQAESETQGLEAAIAAVEDHMEDGLGQEEIATVLQVLQDLDENEPQRRMMDDPFSVEVERLAQALADNRYARTAELLREYADHLQGKDHRLDESGRAILENAQAALEELERPASEVLDDLWGGAPPAESVQIQADDLRWTWTNVAFIDFWAPSRAVKGTPPEVKTEGTITEFPYFSAILGDHHPHHFALTVTLLALSACVALIRVTGRCTGSMATFFRRATPAMLAMGFSIGFVFGVNTWDAIVLAPMYGLVVLLAMRGTRPGEDWAFVGFAGFMVLLALVVGFFYNSVPDVAPLFQVFPGFLLAVAVLAGGLWVYKLLMPGRSLFTPAAVLLGVATVIIFIAAQLAPGAWDTATLGGQLRQGARDWLLFLILAGISASWTFWGRPTVGRWWYAAGSVYLVVGLSALLVVAPYKAFNVTPVDQSEDVLLYETLPPYVSYAVRNTNNFWETFWKNIPLSQVPENLRTEFRDFILHFGLFFIPILVWAIGRFFTLARRSPPGFAFMVSMLALGLMAFAKNYLQFWLGPVALALMVLALFYAFSFRKRAEAAMWILLAGAFFWTWFPEAVHFADVLGGHYARYNTIFKLYYVLWPIYAAGMVVAVREVVGRLRAERRTPGELATAPEAFAYLALLGIGLPWLLRGILPAPVVSVLAVAFWLAVILVTAVLIIASRKRQAVAADYAAAEAGKMIARWPALAAGLVILLLGMLYPAAATDTRTQGFFTWPVNRGMITHNDPNRPQANLYARRTLNALDHFQWFDKYRQDYKAMNWARENLPGDTKLLERAAADAYSHIGRMAPATGFPTVVAWMVHEQTWRGRARPAPEAQKDAYITRLLMEDPELLTRDVPPAEIRRDKLPNFSDRIGRIVKGEMEPLTMGQQLGLVLAGRSERMKMLRDLFPNQSLFTYYIMRRQVENNDITVNQTAAQLLEDARAMFQSTDRQRVRELMGFYGINTVVIGKLERDEFGQNLDQRFLDWGFEKLYDSGEEALPQDELPIQHPTRIYRAPDDFPVVPEVAQ